MYSIYHIVWGVPYSKEIALAANRADGFPDNEVDDFDYSYLEEHGFKFMYCGIHYDIEPGFFGVELDTGGQWELDFKDGISKFYPTNEQISKVKEDISKLPDWLQEAMPEPEVIIIWSTS